MRSFCFISVYKTNIDCSVIGWWWKLSLPRCCSYRPFYHPRGVRLSSQYLFTIMYRHDKSKSISSIFKISKWGLNTGVAASVFICLSAFHDNNFVSIIIHNIAFPPKTAGCPLSALQALFML